MARVTKLGAATALGTLALIAPAAAAPPHVPGELVIDRAGPGGTRVIEVPPGIATAEAATALRKNPHIDYAVPNYIASASAVCPGDPFPACPPNDPGRGGAWDDLQWNFSATPGVGINALGAWQNLVARGRPGARGVKIAVLDSGVAYRNKGRRFKRSPDFRASQFLDGQDFVDNDDVPLDLYGHGTHVAGTIGEQVNNNVGVTGLAYGARILPVRVLDHRGNGTAADVARGIKFAARRNARVINLSFDFPPKLDRRDLPEVHRAIRFANRKGSIVVAAAGNRGRRGMPWPAAGSKVIAVGASARSGCLTGYSNRGPGLDIVAPGGDSQDSSCPPSAAGRSHIVQMTLHPEGRPFTRFGLPTHYFGTSQAAPHVSAIAAMVIASRVIGSRPTPRQMVTHLRATGTALPAPFDYARLVNAAAATSP